MNVKPSKFSSFLFDESSLIQRSVKEDDILGARSDYGSFGTIGYSMMEDGQSEEVNLLSRYHQILFISSFSIVQPFFSDLPSPAEQMTDSDILVPLSISGWRQ
jgi:hypothetical protein